MSGEVLKKLYIITKDDMGHWHHYVSSKAFMHYDVILEFDVDLDKETVIQKGFILDHHRIYASYSIQNKKNNDTT